MSKKRHLDKYHGRITRISSNKVRNYSQEENELPVICRPATWWRARLGYKLQDSDSKYDHKFIIEDREGIIFENEFIKRVISDCKPCALEPSTLGTEMFCEYFGHDMENIFCQIYVEKIKQMADKIIKE